jgi:hypothetical protein
MKLTQERIITYKAFKYYLKTLIKKNAPLTFLHRKGRRGQRWGLRSIISQGIVTQKLTKKTAPQEDE